MSSHPASSSSGLRPRIAPSMLSCDLAKFADESQRMMDDGADWLHLDVMDGHFVPNLTFGAPVIQWVRKSTTGFLDCHLMVTQPEKWVDDFAKAGCNQFTFHIEVEGDKPALIKKIKSLGMRCGIAIKPKTPIETVFPYVEQHHIDEVLVMTVEPGFGGQSFMSDMMSKVATLRKKYPHLDIEVDGGVAEDTIDVCAAAGANAIVSGTGVFKAKSPRHAIAAMRASVQKQIDENFPQLSKYDGNN